MELSTPKMSNNEMIETLTGLVFSAFDRTTPKEREVLDMVIERLSVEPCDCISRAQAVSDYADWYGYGYRDNTFYKHLKTMPSVQPIIKENLAVEDCISRQSALKCFEYPNTRKSDFVAAIKQLPTVRPKSVVDEEERV